MTEKQRETIRSLKKEIKLLRRFKSKCNRLNNEIFRKDEEIIKLIKRLEGENGRRT